MLRLTEWMADYYLCPWGQVLEAVVPAGVRWQAGTRRKSLSRCPTDAPRAGIAACSVASQAARDHRPGGRRRQAARSGQGGPGGRLHAGADQSAAQHGAGVARTAAPPPAPPPTARRDTEAFDAQCRSAAALDAILAAFESRQHATVLLHGVTGSGKTEVYIQAIDEVLRYGRQAIVLVPEISLTPQTEQRFRARFGRVAVLHSHQTDTERHRHWQQIAAGDVRVVVGARSAIFAPTPHLGLIVLDEEHEASFKQDSARAITPATWRSPGRAWNRFRWCSVRPRLRWKVGSGPRRAIYQLVSLPRRVFDRPLPGVGTIDLRLEFQNRRSRGAVSRQLHIAMDEALRRRRPGDSAAQPPRLFHPHPMPRLRPRRPLSAIVRSR